MAMTTRGRGARERALGAAVKVFAASGYDNGSLNDVAFEAGMSRHNLLYYYPSKRELLIAVLEHRDADFDARLRWMEPSTEPILGEFEERLVELFPVIYADRELVLLYHRLTIEAVDPAHPAHDWVLARYRRTRAAAARVLRSAVARGEVRDDLDIDGFATAMLGAIEGIEAQWLVEPDVDWSRATCALVSLISFMRAV